MLMEPSKGWVIDRAETGEAVDNLPHGTVRPGAADRQAWPKTWRIFNDASTPAGAGR